MKIYYINGYDGENSIKPKQLSQILETEVQHIIYNYKENNILEIANKCKDADLIIASSTGAYIARKICFDNTIPLISLNPVTNLEETFKKLGIPKPKIEELPKNYSLCELILINKDDELIDYKTTSAQFPNKSKVFETGGHRFENILDEDVKEAIKDFLKYIF